MQKPIYFENEGQFISGTLHIPEGGGPAPGVVFCHGFTGTKVESHFIFVAAARELERRGIVSLRFDFRGSGESEGEFVDMTPSGEISDALRAVHVVAGLPEVDAGRIGVVGLSLGGMVAACLAGRDARVKSVVLWSALAEIHRGVDTERSATWSDQMETQGWADAGGLKVGKIGFEDRHALRPARELADSDAPVLIVHGSNDTVVPPEHAQFFLEKASRPGRKVHKQIIDGADHTFNRVDWTDEVIQATADWLAGTL